MAQETKESKWEGKAIAELKATKPEQIWPLIEDFCTIHKWLPTIDTCQLVQGTYGEPGLVRYCASSIQSSSFNDVDGDVKWCHEKLLSIDRVERCLSYEIEENNLGFTYYVVELKVIEVDGGGCRIEWLFTAEPVEGWGFEDLCGYIESSLKTMVERMEKELQVQVATNDVDFI